MTTTIDRTNNAFDSGWPVTVADKQVDTSATSINLLGRGVTNYGELVMESLVRMLEHFANTTPPPNPITGQLWYEADPATPGTGTLKVYNGVTFVPIGGVTVGSTFPASPSTGQLFYNPAMPTDLWIFDGTSWWSVTGFSEGTTDPSLLGSGEGYRGRFYYRPDTNQFFIWSDTVGNWVEIVTASGGGGITVFDLGDFQITVNDNVAAAGTTQTTATELDAVLNVVTSAGPSANGVRFPGPPGILASLPTGSFIMVVNASSETIYIYPDSSGRIDSLAVGAPYPLGPGAKLTFWKTSAVTNQYYAFDSIYGA